jgi:hypothetical protein
MLDGPASGSCDHDGLSDALGLCEALGETLGLTLGLTDAEGETLGLRLALGDRLGETLTDGL